MALRVRKVGEIVEPEDAFSTTEMEKETFSFTWEIADFPELREKLKSPVFKGGPKAQHDWRLEVLPQYQNKKEGEEASEKFVGIFLHLETSSRAPDKKVDFQCSLLDSGRKILHSTFTNWALKDGNGLGWNEWILKSKVLKTANGFLSHGHKLRIHCEIQTCGEFKHGAVSTKPVLTDLKSSGKNSQSDWSSTVKLTLDLDSLELQKKIMSFLTKGKFSDVTLKTESESFPCYKFILSAHSPVFEAMFDSGMIESSENVVEIKDFSAHAVRGMIQFLCTGKTELLEENPGELLSIADKYQISGLKAKCEGILLKKLAVENAAATLILAHLHSPQILKPHVIYFINRFKKQVLNTAGYKEMVNAYPIICSELYASLDS